MTDDITPQLLLSAYAQGYFPMARSRTSRTLSWFRPDPRGIIPLESFHISRSLHKILRHAPFDIRIDSAFAEVIRACAAIPRKSEQGSWINRTIIDLYTALSEMGHAHSVECWRENTLVGGLYGVSLGGAFFGESMFSRAPNASKIALVHLVARLKAAGYSLLDTQYLNPHLLQFGAVEVPLAHYMDLLENALNTSPNPSTRFLTASPRIS